MLDAHLDNDQVVIVEYDPRWPVAYAEEKIAVCAALTGMLTVLCGSGLVPADAAVVAARASTIRTARRWFIGTPPCVRTGMGAGLLR